MSNGGNGNNGIDVRDLYERLGAIGAQLNDLGRIRDTANRAEDKADEAMVSARNAHSRLNDSDKRHDKVEAVFSYIWKTIAGALILAVLALIMA